MIPEGWRLVMFRSANRWLEPVTEGDPPKLTGGLELPEGAKVHSIVPLLTRERFIQELEKIDTEVLEWAVFVAVPPEALA